MEWSSACRSVRSTDRQVGGTDNAEVFSTTFAIFRGCCEIEQRHWNVVLAIMDVPPRGWADDLVQPRLCGPAGLAPVVMISRD